MNLVNWLHSLAVLDERLERLSDDLEREQQVVRGVDKALDDLRERITRLEAWREADRALLDADLSRFRAEAERVELRLSCMLEAGDATRGVP